MLCYIVLRVYCPNTINFIRKGRQLGFKQNVDIDTGETWYYGARAKTKGLRFLYKKTEKKINCIEISGSLHKYANSGIHNYNDFTFADIFKTIYTLAKEFGLNPHTTTVHGLEFGINLQLPFAARLFLNEIVLYKKQLGDIERFRGNGLYRLFDFEEYAFKLYDKAQQYCLPNANILRVEKKYKVMAALPEDCNIKSLADLLNIENHKPLAADLISCLRRLTVYDSNIGLDSLSLPNRKFLLKSLMPNYWDNLINGKQNTYQSTLRRYNNLIAQHGKHNTKQLLETLIGEKLCSFYKSHNEQIENVNQFLAYTKNKTYQQLLNLPEWNCTTFRLLGNNGVSNSTIKQCLWCGKDISHQNIESKFCSEKRIGKAGKQCRDKYRYWYGNKLTIFPVNELIISEKSDKSGAAY